MKCPRCGSENVKLYVGDEAFNGDEGIVCYDCGHGT